MRDPRYDILFEPVPLGPVTARNRFFQVPHCNGMGHHHPTAHAHMRGVKAEGGWAVVCTEEVEIHPSSEVSPYIEGRLWDDADIPALARMTEKIHEHGSLAGIEPCHNGIHGANMYTRETGMAVGHLPVGTYDPVQVRRMGADDILALRRWHRAAVRRSLEAGFDVVYVYAAHGLNTIGQFLSRKYNLRTDGYGGSLENRARLLREMLEDTLDEVDGRAAVACRITVDELVGADGIDRPDIEGVLGLVGELPDVWDFVVGEWENDSSTSRFAPEAVHEEYVRGLKALTSKPVVGVGRFTSPDTMVRMVRDGVLDMIGAARPSIADPFLPRKIEEGRLEDIRECIGCNICVSGDGTISPIRCTQNPSMGEEWRRGWHPEVMRPKTSDASVLVVGAGPAGLEAAMALGKRGHRVVLAEATQALGGRVAREARLPGLAEWIRVLDYRRGQLDRLPDVEIAYDSRLTAEEVLEYGFDHVAVATGCRWRADGVGRWHLRPIELEGIQILTPDDVMAGTELDGGRVVVYDDDHYYLGGVVAEALARQRPRGDVRDPRSASLGVDREHARAGADPAAHARGGDRDRPVPVRSTGRAPEPFARPASTPPRSRSTPPTRSSSSRRGFPTTAWPPTSLARAGEWEAAGLTSVRAVGDALCPGTIAAAVWDGRRYAEQLGEPLDADGVPFLREIAGLSPDG